MANPEMMQLLYLGIVVVAVLARNLVGWLQSKQSFDWRQFIVSTFPAMIVLGMMAFEVDPVWNFKTAFALFLGAGGFAEFQGKIANSKKLGKALLSGKK